ncbi:unnamed protein product [Caenorhabditis auriculariae]|uniref:SCP domain-containing protein n=1 Tax=Caenorhabditis auriculariae TaxID=2777116 RepID=A0A8S1GPF3_9PELO|nr:unnamed protein product [Caenorhabditis auriculariae]
MNTLVTIALLFLIYRFGQSAIYNEGSGVDPFEDPFENNQIWEDNDEKVLQALNSTDGELLTDDICNGTTLAAFQRDLILKTHNDLRRLLANGRQRNKRGLMRSGKNIYKLQWDCELEDLAASWTADCPRTFMPDSLLGSHSQIYKMFYFYFDGEDMNKHIKTSLKSWWSQGQERGNNDTKNRYSYKNNYYSWANMAKGKTYRIGCSYVTCPDNQSAVFTCLYNEKAQCEEEMIYEPGKPCKKDEDCSTYPGSTCDTSEGLCEAPIILRDNGASNMCSNDNMSDASRIWTLNQHNFYRSRIARGLEWNGETNTSQPKAARMLKMEYDCKLEAYAQEWANNCVFAHSNNYERPNQGQNLYMTSFSNPDPRGLFHTAIEKWWQELEEFGTPEDNMLTADLWAKKGKDIGHYTQMAWERSFRLGCAMTVCPHMAFVVCHYSPAGNRKKIIKSTRSASPANLMTTVL